METDTLPYTLFLIVAELGLGSLLAMQFVDMRGFATRGFIKATMIMLPFVLGLAFWVALTLEGTSRRASGSTPALATPWW